MDGILVNCKVCGDITGNKASHLLIRYNPHERHLPVCRFCLEDFELLGSKKWQVEKI